MNAPAQSPLLTVQRVAEFDRSAVTRSIRTALAAARSHALATREQVDAYAVPMLAGFGIVDEKGAEILNPRDLYLAADTPEQDAKVQAYFAALDVAHVEHGFKVETGYCPALVAEHAVVKFENALLAHGAEFLGVDATAQSGRLRADALRLFESGPAAAQRIGRRR